MASHPATMAALESLAASASEQCGRVSIDLQKLALHLDPSLLELRAQMKALSELATDAFLDLNRMCRLIAKASASDVSIDSRQRIHDVVHSSTDFLAATSSALQRPVAQDGARAEAEARDATRADVVWKLMIQVIGSSLTLLELNHDEARNLVEETALQVAAFKEKLSQSIARSLAPLESEEQDSAPPSYDMQVETASGAAIVPADTKSQNPSLQAQPASVTEDHSMALARDADHHEEVNAEKSRGPMGFFRSLVASLKTIEPLLPALCSAAAAGQYSQVQSLLQQGANANGRNEFGDTPLVSAIKGGQMDIVKLLVENGANMKTEDSTLGIPPLFHAAKTGRADMLAFLLDSGADPRASSGSGSSYFNQTAEHIPLDLLQELLKYGANARAENVSGVPVIVKIVEKGDVPRARMLLDWGANITSTTGWGDSLLTLAIKGRNPSMVRFLLDRGASPDSKSASGQYVLSAAVSEDLEDVARLLLERRAKVNSTNATDTPCLITAIQKDLIHMTNLLLQHKANPDIQDNMGRSAVQVAVQQHRLAHLHALLKHGANADVYSLRDNPILTVAVTDGLPQKDLPDYIRLLTEHGASPHKTASKATPQPGAKKTPFAVIVATGHIDNVKALLIAGGASKLPPGTQMDSEAILETAAQTGRIQIVRALLEAGVGTTQMALKAAHRACKENMVFALEDQVRQEGRQSGGSRETASAGVSLLETPPPYSA